MSRKDLVLCIGVLVVVAIVIGTVYFLTPVDTELMLREAQASLASQQFEEAERIALVVLSHDDESAAALTVAGHAASGREDYEKSLDYFSRIPNDRSRLARNARFLSGDILLTKMNRLTESEQMFRKSIEQDPDYVEAHDKLIHVLTIGGRYREASAQILELVRLGDLQRFCSKIGVFMLGSEADRLITIQPSAQTCHEAEPDDPAPMIALAVAASHENNDAEARQLLERVVASYPELLAAQVWLGRTLLKVGTTTEIVAWGKALPKTAVEHADIWAIRGGIARATHERKAAVRCFYEAVRRDANLEKANFELGQVLLELGEKDTATPFLQRADQLSKYRDAVGQVTKTPDKRYFQECIAIAKSLGMDWEAHAWKLVAQNPAILNAAVDLSLPRWAPPINGDTIVRTSRQENPAFQVDMSHYPLPDWSEIGSGETKVATNGPTRISSFEDQASEQGLVFEYNNSGDPRNQILTMQETLGGGIGAFDYDLDGWPDIYFAQGSAWPAQDHPGEYLDRLFRNLDGRFVDIMTNARIAEDRFSHGVTIGDYNSDGFPDILVCNIGVNRLWQNNGDGTFSDVSATAGFRSNRWTTSAVLADFNGDRLPDIYAVSYVTSADVHTRICKNAEGVSEPCPPNDFTPSQDQVFLNLGDGRFEEQTNSAGVAGTGGNGLGIVAIDTRGTGTLDLFVANDVTPNHFFINDTKTNSLQLKFIEDGLLSGLAVNTEGTREACMGIATGDTDGNGTIDIFVGNFMEETNTLYRQLNGESFLDVTQEAGLDEVSRSMTAFGAEFLDGELDGDLDLIVTNGHINATKGGPEFLMPAHYYQNLGDGTFIQDSPDTLGDYFSQKYLGRGLALIDWNRDGASDVVVTYLGAPVSLLTNTTEERGHYVTVELRGVTSSRDAIGTTVTLEVGDKKLVRQLTGGDGYLVTNQRVLSFGLGRDQPARISVRWPSGETQSFEAVDADSHVLIIEGRDHLFSIAH